MNALDQYIELYRSEQAALCAPCSPLLNKAREQAFINLCRQGFPAKSEEEYRYTDTATLFDHNYGINLHRATPGTDPYRTFRCDIPQMDTHLYYIVNDTPYPAPQTGTLPTGVIIGSLNRASLEHPLLFEKYYNRLAGQQDDGITAFNTTFVQDGLLVYIPKGVTIEKPIQIINITHSKVDLMLLRRLLVIVEEGAQARLLLCDHTADKVKYLSSQVAEVYVGNGAQLDYIEMEETHTGNCRLSTLLCSQQADSTTRFNNTTITNGVTRNTTRILFQGEGGDTNLTGLAIGDKKQHIDNNTRIEHLTPRCTSNELYKYVLDDSATGAFSGRVLVNRGAQQTVSRQTNRNLCLTPNAHIYAQPQLEIYADDVQCSHGATVGQLDENALFYMQQRGITLQEARFLLMSAFVNEVIDTVDVEAVRSRLHLLVEKRFRGDLNKCHNCTLCKNSD